MSDLSESGKMKFCIKEVKLIESEFDKICQSSWQRHITYQLGQARVKHHVFIIVKKDSLQLYVIIIIEKWLDLIIESAHAFSAVKYSHFDLVTVDRQILNVFVLSYVCFPLLISRMGMFPIQWGVRTLKQSLLNLTRLVIIFPYQQLGPRFGCALPGYSFIDDVFEQSITCKLCIQNFCLLTLVVQSLLAS